MVSGIRNESYLIINLFFATAIVFIMAYSAIFSPEKNNYPVVCIHEKLTGEQCSSCGLSHSFSLILRGKISEAFQWNSYGMRIFIFFAAQLAMRVVFSVIYMKNKEIRRQLITMDISGSGIIFLIAFWPLILDLVTRIH
jgi:hypothetical protein